MSTKTINTHDPSTGAILRRYPCDTPESVAMVLTEVREEFLRWREVDWSERLAFLRKLAEILRAEKNGFAELIRLEMGKLTGEAAAEVEKCAATALYFAENGRSFLAPEPVRTEARLSYVAFEPLGTVLAIMPWNFPFWQALRCAIPAIAAGNTVVLKHASNVSGCSLAIQDLIAQASGRKSLLRAVLLGGQDALPLLSSTEISAVSFTGSTAIGRKIATAAGANLKKSVLELGGSDAYLILEDADVAFAAKTCASSRLICAGQSCIAAKRFIVHSSRRKEFVEALAAEMSKAPLAPLAREDIRKDLHSQVERSLGAGAKLVQGGKVPTGSGFHYPATVLDAVKAGMPAFDEETFGPVAAVVEAQDEREAVALANLTPYGLGAAVFSRDEARAERIARASLEAGSAFVNAFVRSDPRLPFGGIKESGYGRELSRYGMLEFVNVKSVYVGV